MNTSGNPQVLYQWSSPARAYKKRSPDVLKFYIALSLLLSVVAFFFGEKILILPIWTLMGFFYILTTTPPSELEHKITRFGVESAGATIRWEALSHFYFTKRFSYHILVLISIPPYFHHIYLVVPSDTIKKELIGILSEYLIYQEKPSIRFTDRAAEWFTRLMPEEKSVAQNQ